MWAIWVLIAGAALASFYALLPDAHLSGPPPDMPAALAGDMATYRSQLENYVINNHTANGVVPQNVFVHSGNWNYTSLRWQNYVNNGIVVVYPSTSVAPLPTGFLGAMLKQASYSVEAGASQNGQIINPANTSGNVSLPAGMPPLPDGTPVWIAQVF
ncbi:type IV pilus biogenesis protein PilM [Paraburkholderia sp.]|uniref:type IV pilus biogenesis protein PilM n=1 Tax=Paraburkholderia sp. TaxID=1926495 RepID=UPI003D6DDE2F